MCLRKPPVGCSRISEQLNRTVTSAYVHIRQHTSAYVSRPAQAASWELAYLGAAQSRGCAGQLPAAPSHARLHTSVYVSIRQHQYTSAYVARLRRSTASCAFSRAPVLFLLRQYLYFCTSTASTLSTRSVPELTSAYVSIRQHTSAYVSTRSIRQHTSAYVSIREYPQCSSTHAPHRPEA